MAHISPAVNLIWAILTAMLGTFLVFHLWSFDRFRCLKWNHGPYSGAFKRVMTYSYLLSVPLILTYALGFAIIKYTYGFTMIPGEGVMPVPYQLWSLSAQNAILPLYISLSIGWGLEMVTHLEELCFWLFLVNSTSAQQDWFRSLYFKIWAAGSCIAVLAMPLITIFTRKDVYKCEAYTFLTGGLASLSLTIWFLPVLWTFPSFIENLNVHNVGSGTLARLTKYYELNCYRVVFRFLFTLPLVILGVDGVRPHQHINDKMFPIDLLGILAGIGCAVSSGITLVIFFPRSIESEMAQKEQQRSRRRQRAQKCLARWNRAHTARTDSTAEPYISITQQSKTDLDHYDPFGMHNSFSFGMDKYPGVGVSLAGSALPAYETVMEPTQQADQKRVPSIKRAVLDDKSASISYLGGSLSLQPNRRTLGGNIELGAVLTESEVELARAVSKRDRSVSSLVHHWRSPIEIGRPPVPRWQRPV